MSTLNLVAQKSSIDSIKHVLEQSTEKDTIHVQRLMDLAWMEKDENLKHAKETLIKSNDLSKDLNWTKGEVKSLSKMVYILNRNGEVSNAIKKGFEAISLLQDINDDKLKAELYRHIGDVYRLMRDEEHTKENYNKALEFATSSSDAEELAKINISLGLFDVQRGDYETARNHVDKSLQESLKLRNFSLVARAYDTKGHIEILVKNYPKAKEYYLLSKSYLGNSKKYNIISYVNTQLSLVYMEMNQMDSALLYANDALSDAKKYNLQKPQRDAYFLLFQIHTKNDEHQKALRSYIVYDSLNNVLYNMDVAKEVEVTKAKYEAQKKKELASKELERQKLIRNSIAAGLGLTLLFLIVVYRQRNKIKKAKARSEKLLLNILPERVAEELKDKGRVDSQLMDEVTVLFTDFKGFTQMSELLSPAELVNEINICFSAFDEIVTKFGIEKIKTIGDAYMAVGGLPTANKTHAIDVVQAAIEIQEFMLNMANEKKSKNEPFFEIRIGLHSGPVIAGIVGLKKFQYDIWGDTVNTASRMESSSEVGKVNISETTYNIVKSNKHYTFESRGKVNAKGKGMMEMYYVEKIIK